VLPHRPALTRMMSTRPLDLRGGSIRFVSLELPGGRPALFKSANGLLKSLTLDLCPLAIQCPCLPETTRILQSPRLLPEQSASPSLLLHLQLLAKKLLPRASQRGLEAINRRQKDIQPPGLDLLDRSGIQVGPLTEFLLGQPQTNPLPADVGAEAFELARLLRI